MNEALKSFKKYFDLREVVRQAVYVRYGQQAWQFFDPRLLAVVVWVREGTGWRLVCNNWTKGGKFDERGFRDNLSPLVLAKTLKGILYASAHERGMAIDLSSPDATAEQIRQWIRDNIDECPFPIRLEKGESAPTWCHIDVCNMSDKKLVEFAA